MLKKIEHALKEIDPTYLAVGYLRYEAVRKLPLRKYAELWQRALRGERFDEIVDELICNEAGDEQAGGEASE